MTTLESPYTSEGTWLRGNLHAHSTNSDGDRPPARVVDDYATRGYDFLAISDHDTFTDPDSVDSHADVVLLPAVEVSDGGPHVLHVDATTAVEPAADRQAVVDSVAADDGIAIPAHPNWKADFAHWSQEDLERIDGYPALEIYNGLIETHPGSALATDRWDRLLSAGRRVWGVANDDYHRPWNVAEGWTVVQAEARTRNAILDALRAGSFYASTGVAVTDVTVEDGIVAVETADAEAIRLVSDHGVVQQTVDAPRATFHVPEQLVYRSEHTYVRVECVGRGGEMAWLQPMFLNG
jgi:hypothetical protein